MAHEPENRADPRRTVPTKPLGDAGERVASAHLELLGWHILATRYRSAYGEIDIVAEETTAEGPTLVFVEVKARRGTAFGAPAESVTARKRKRLTLTALRYLEERARGGAEPACRFDVAEVFFGADGLARVNVHRAGFGFS